MLQILKNAQNTALTENGAAAYRTSESYCLDLFAAIGALRHASEEDITDRFMKAYAEDADTAMKILFFGRDIRGGLGERRTFRTALKALAAEHPASVRKNIPLIAEYGRFDDLLVLLGTRCEKEAIAFIGSQLKADMAALEAGGSVSLLGKWLPSVNASNTETVAAAKKIARALRMTDAAYRRTLVKLRARIRIIENNLRERDYSFDYAVQPSNAMIKYRRAFLRNDKNRYQEYLAKVKRGEAKLHTGTLFPYDIIAPLLRSRDFSRITNAEREAMDTTWNTLEDFANDENALVVMDGSGSMYSGFFCDSGPTPISVAMSLAIYFAERSTGAFRNHFITFSETPRLVEIMGQDIVDKVRHCARFNEAANTNIQAVFELILNTAVRNELPQEEMPSTLYIISDMEFDVCTKDAGTTNFQYAREQFEAHGYQLPRVVFWNVDSRNEQQPVTRNEQGAALVSGASPRVFNLLRQDDLTPYACMMDIIGSERYEKISA